MTSTTQNITRRVESVIPMTRFSISEDEEEAPLIFKRARLSEFASQCQGSIHPSQSRVAIEEDNELEEFIPIEDVESDSQAPEDDELFETEEEDEASDHGEVEPIPEGQNQQQQMTPIASTVFNSRNGELHVVLTDPDVLDCPICLEPLCTPVFQCENGHIACSSCCSKVERKCPSCCMPIGYNRCRAIEMVIESVKVSCKNARYGCTKTMTYSKKNEHEQTCPHTTCFCPHSSCPYAGSSNKLYLHFGIQHAASTTRFTYNTPFFVNVTANQNHLFLQERHESVIFILNHQVKERCRAFSVDCVGPSMLKTCFVYQLTAKNTEATLFLQCVPEIYTKWYDHAIIKNYLTVPSDFLGCSGALSLHVCIKKATSLV